MKQAHVFFSGQVQGVFYRDFVKREADRVGVAGWVRNNSDGRVEAVFLGSKKDVEELLTRCEIGPDQAVVDGVDAVYEEPESFQSFVIRR